MAASTTTRVFMCMGWGAPADGAFFPFLKSRLEAAGATVTALPGAADAEIDKHVAALAEKVGDLDEHTFFVGQSVGNQVIMRYLATAGSKKAGGWVAIAPWLVCDYTTEKPRESWWDDFFREPSIRAWCETPCDYDAVKAACGNVCAIISDDDPVRGLDSNGEENAADFRDKLGARVLMRSKRGHFFHLKELDEEEVAAMLETCGLNTPAAAPAAASE